MSHGKFIVVEGIDGSGKTTACQWIYEALSAQQECFATVEPRHAGTGADIRKILRGEALMPPPMILAAMFAIDRYHHTARIRERLEAGVHVICDRYLWSTYAYQVAARDLNRAFAVKHLHDDFYLAPDLVIYLDITPQAALTRLEARGGQSVFDNLDRVADAHNSYQVHLIENRAGFAPHTRLEIVYADAEPPIVKQRVLDALHRRNYL